MTSRRSRTQPNQLANRRPGALPGRRFGLALGLALTLLGSAGVASADPGSGPIVTATIYTSGGGTSSTSVSSSQLLADPQTCPAYPQANMTEYSDTGSTSVGLPQSSGSGTGTWSLSTVLQCLQNPVSVGDVTGITVFNVDGSPQVATGSQLTPADLASPSDFQSDADSPVISDLGSSSQYNRPWRGQGDLNASDQVTSADPIAIDVFEGPPLTVDTSASPPSPAAGSSVSFSATVTGNRGSALTYNWRFGDNLPDSAQAGPSVTYTDGGSYTVTLQVTDAAGGAGGSTLPITVSGSPSSTLPPTTSTPTTNTGANGTGSNPSGGTSGSTGANGKGTGKTPSNGNGNTGTPAQPTSSHTQKPSHAGGAGSSASSGSRTTTVSPSTTGSPSATGSPSTTASPSSTSSPSATLPAPQRRITQHPGHRPPTHTRLSPTSGSPGQLVTGRLVADVTPLPAGASPLVRTSPGSASAAPPRNTPRSPVAVIAGCLAVVLLLGLGAGRELRGRRWRPTLRSSN